MDQNFDRPDFEKAYVTWYRSHHISRRCCIGLSGAAAREMRCILERLFMSLCETNEEEWLYVNDKLFAKAQEEIANCKKLDVDPMKIIHEITGGFDLNVTTPDSPPVMNENVFSYGEFSVTLPPALAQRYKKYPLEEVITMLMRIHSLCPQGQQWAMPRDWFANVKKRYGHHLIGFSSPLNTQVENIPFCSIHSGDVAFGGVGDIFRLNFREWVTRFAGRRCTVTMNPPFIEQVMSDSADLIENWFEVANELKVELTILFNGPEWSDAAFYTKLMKSKYLKADKLLGKGKHRYQDCLTFKTITAYFGSHLFALDNHSNSPNYYNSMALGIECADGRKNTSFKHGGRGARYKK